MGRYLLEVSYRGNNYAGFQIQKNAPTIQLELEKALGILYRETFSLTGSSRTDAGVHALQNYFHFDTKTVINDKALYNLNAILPPDIAVKSVKRVPEDFHCRFSALSREYHYYIYQHKNPFLENRAFYYPYTLNINLLKEAAAIIPEYSDFTTFSKRNTQVKTFQCKITVSEWVKINECWVYKVQANRFLRGMVRGLVGTMLQVGREKLSLPDFRKVIEAKDCTKADFAVPGHGLFLVKVHFPG